MAGQGVDEEDWNAEMGDEVSAILPLLEQSSLFGRPNGLSSDFSPSAGSFGAVERPNRSESMQDNFGGHSRGRGMKDERRGRPQSGISAGGRGVFGGHAAASKECEEIGSEKGFQERIIKDSNTQHRGFKGFPGGFGGSAGFQEMNVEDSGMQNRGYRGFPAGFGRTESFQERNVEDSGIENRSSRRFPGGFGRSEGMKDERRGRPQSGISAGGRGVFGGHAAASKECEEIGSEKGFQERIIKDSNTQHRGFKGFPGGFGGSAGFQEMNVEDSGMQNRGYRGFPAGFGRTESFQERNVEDSGIENRSSRRFPGGFGRSEGPKVTYVPPPPPEDEQAIFARYQTGINFDKYDDNVVEVSGLDPPAPILTFEDANLCHTLNKNIAKAGYSKLTPVQKYSIPVILAGRDLMACAHTGSGKTAAFLLPIVAHMMRDGITATSFKEQQEPECIIVAPTRELINQIFLEARKFVYGTCIRPVVIYGGTQTGHSIRQVMQGCNILCATPGRLLDIIGREKIALHNVKYLVLDEADRMLDMGFGSDMKKLISYPSMTPKDQRQTLMFSATFPEEVQRLAREFLKTDYLFVVVGRVGGACSDVQQIVLQVPRYSKRDKLIEILQSTGQERTMVFVDKKKKADYIAAFLCQEKIAATSIHGDREQREREVALQDFRSGRCPVLVATSVAARGLDIEKVQRVINFDLPSTIEEYVHRIGRTGRCGNIGKAICFFDKGSDGHLAESLVKVLSDAQQEVPVWLEEIASVPQGEIHCRSVDNQKNYRDRGNVNTGGMKMAYSATELESWD